MNSGFIHIGAFGIADKFRHMVGVGRLLVCVVHAHRFAFCDAERLFNFQTILGYGFFYVGRKRVREFCDYVGNALLSGMLLTHLLNYLFSGFGRFIMRVF